MSHTRLHLRKERIWYEDPLGMFRGDRAARILPERNAPLAQQLNAVTRFALYYGIVMFFAGRRSFAAITVVLVAACTAAMYRAAAADADIEGATGLSSAHASAHAGFSSSAPLSTCTLPTPDNPFGNVMLSDYTDNADRAAACDIQDPGVADVVEDLFERNLYRDVGDAMHRAASSRQFYTNPSTTIPNDQTAFAKWCYATGPGCKEGDGDRCDVNLFRSMPGR